MKLLLSFTSWMGNCESQLAYEQAANGKQSREIEHWKRQLTEVQVECDQLR